METYYFASYVKDKYRNCLVFDKDTNLDVATIGPDIDRVIIEGARLHHTTIPDNVSCLAIKTRTDMVDGEIRDDRFKLMPGMIPNTIHALQLDMDIYEPDLVPDDIEYLSLLYSQYDYRYLPKQLLILEVGCLELLLPKPLEDDDYSPNMNDLAEIVFPETLQSLFLIYIESDYDWSKIQIPKSLHFIQYDSSYFRHAHVTPPEGVDIVIHTGSIPREEILRNIPTGIYICGDNPIADICIHDVYYSEYDYCVIDSMVRHPFGGYIAKIIHKQYKEPPCINLIRKPAKSARK